MKYFIIIFSVMFSILVVKAEKKEEIMKLLAQRVQLQDPDTFIYSEEARKELAEFKSKHKLLFNSLGKEEIFYHLNLTSELYNEDRPGPQSHAVYAAYLYSKFYSDYTDGEKQKLSNVFNEFLEKGWLRKQDLQISKLELSNREEKPLPDPEKISRLRAQGEQTIEQETSSKADQQSSFLWWLLGIVGFIVVLGFMLLKGILQRGR